MKHLPTHPSHSTADSVRRLLFGNSRPSSSAFLGQQKTNTSLASWSTAGNGSSGEDTEIGRKMCSCLSQLEQICIGPEFEEFVSGDGHYVAPSPSPLAFNSEMGRMLYTISILLMFSLVILLLMFRSIRRSRSTVEVETLLDAMRFREELDLQQRQKKRLRKAKKKVTAWLCRGNGAKLWQLSPHILLPSQQPAIIRTNSLQSSGSFIPEIVISEHLPPSNALGPPEDLYGRTCIERQNSYTPSLSLIYDFSSRRNSQMCSSSLDLEESSENGRLSQSSGLSGSGGGGGAGLKEESSSSGGADGGIAMKEVPTRGKPIVVGGK